MPSQDLKQRGRLQYDLDYFSGSQASIYIGDVWVDDIVAWQVNLNQKKFPIYGYADQYFSEVAPGQISVTGSFSINFKESGYLWVILNRYLQRNKSFKQIELENEKFGKSFAGNAKDEVAKLREDIEKRLQRTAKESIQYDKKSKRNQSSKDRFFEGFSQSDKIFEDLAEAFEDQIWGPLDKTESGISRFNTPNVGFGESLEPDKARRADQYPGFDILITYGDFGTVQTDPKVNHTLKRIVECHIVGESQVIVANGEAIQEEYTFFAKNFI